MVGLTLLRHGGWPLLVVGVVSIASGVAYTGGPFPLGYHGLGDVFVFIFFGLVAVAVTFFVQTGHVSVEAWMAGAAIGALATNILLVNNYRDAGTDAKAGKRTLVVRFGKSLARVQFAVAHGVALAVMLELAERLALRPALIVPAGLARRGAGGVANAACLSRACKRRPNLSRYFRHDGRPLRCTLCAVAVGLPGGM